MKVFDYDSLLQHALDLADTIEKSEKFIRELFSKSKRDLKSARLNYADADEIFDNSIGALQQAVEKTAKGIYVLNTGASEKDLKNVGHKSPNAFMEVFKRSSAKYGQLVRILNPDWDETSIILQIEKLVGEPEKIVKMKEAVIDKLLSLPRQIISKDSELNKVIRDAFNRLDVVQALKKGKSDVTENNTNKLIESIYAFYSIYVMSVITFPHSESTRYRAELMAPDDYKKGLGIVDAAPKLFDELDNCISVMEGYLNFLSQSVQELKKSQAEP